MQDLLLSGSMGPYVWTINGRTYDDTVPLTIRQGQAGRLRIAQPLDDAPPAAPARPHLPARRRRRHRPPQGHRAGPRDGRRRSVDFAADNPGQWMVHCHNAYHAEAGMMTRLDYVT